MFFYIYWFQSLDWGITITPFRLKKNLVHILLVSFTEPLCYRDINTTNTTCQVAVQDKLVKSFVDINDITFKFYQDQSPFMGDRKE